ncbi:type II toxin-antitoxin system RelE/ParE family toxin [Flavobacterium branchiicola]|uniref:Type II toxin-antitoxin system RelE/ParE family toxin n=1 Tax=Flavobacterium branchiicola TaxID=1114875 RepID=A0ABV9PGS3_9FLAO|nr:type II toxin-antitoxin system RelE/ParE family toxin [Flavobacterium branchiicola]MBS7255051.1 type II toxin-antitoxin system RelE/ParE family toxin [Flavobacterium branchiicola]
MGRKETQDSKQYTLDITQNYFQNLEEIVDYIAFEKLQPLNAIKIGNGINKTLNRIINDPLIYSECENLPTKTKIYREVNYKTWLIVFKVKRYHITILGVLSGKRKKSSFKRLK